MFSFAAMDFETATAQRSSACSIGLAIVRDGQLTETFSSLIRPPEGKVSPRHAAIHGITDKDLAGAPSMKDVWATVQPMLEGLPIVCHNAQFDIRVLISSLGVHGCQPGSFHSLCTYELAKHVLPGLENHKLPMLAGLFGIPLDHHDPVSDAVACATLAPILLRILNVTDIQEVLTHWLESPGPSPDAYEDDDEEFSSVAAGVPQAGGEPFVFHGMNMVFTGEMQAMSREKAEQLAASLGATIGKSVSRQTQYVVVGDRLFEAYQRTGHATGKLSKAVKLIEGGSMLMIISETEFVSALKAGQP